MPRRNKVELQRLHDRLLSAFRTIDAADLASFKFAAERSGCSVQIAKRAYSVGLARGLRPISDLLSEEKMLARSVIRKEEIADRLSEASDTARQDAIESRARAGKLIVAGQEALTQLLNGFLNSHLAKFASQIANGQVEEMKLGELVTVLRSLVGSARELQVMESTILGSPSLIIGGEVTIAPQTEAISIADARVELEAAARALQSVEQEAEENAIPAGSGQHIH